MPETTTSGKVAPEAVYDFLADLWMRSSLQMELLARGSAISYYHFLQPTQYVPQSKTAVGREKRLWDEEGRFARHVLAGYPLLQGADRGQGPPRLSLLAHRSMPGALREALHQGGVRRRRARRDDVLARAREAVA